MDKDDSNGNSFEIVDKSTIDQLNNGADKSGTLSSISSPFSIPSPGSVSLSATGNLLSNVGPPSSLPDFTLWPSTSGASPEAPAPNTLQTIQQPQPLNVVNTAPVLVNQYPTPQFSPAVFPSKGIPQEVSSSHQPAKPTSHPLEAEPVTQNSFLGLVKGAFSSQVMSKMVEKAKSSVDSIITTLDPQMSEYIYSGGDLEITVTSEEEDIVAAIREAAHVLFGKAWVNGIKLGTVAQKAQAVGLDSGLVIAEERIDYSFKFRKTPTVAVESVLLKEGKSWYDVSLLVLKDREYNITVSTFSQAVPIPVDKFLSNEVADIDIDQKLSESLKNVPCWQEEVSGVPRKEVIFLAGKVLLKLYKDRISQTTKNSSK